MLGDAANTLTCRHGHQTARRPGTDDWIVVTGDASGDIHWIRITYDEFTGLATSSATLINGTLDSTRYFGVGLNFVNQELLKWSTDIIAGGTAAELGIWQNDPDNLSGKTGETRVKDLGAKTLFGFIIQNDKAVVCGEGGDLDTSFAVITDSGSGTVTYIPVPDKLSSANQLLRAYIKDSNNFVKINVDGHDKPARRTVMYKV